MNTPQCIAFCLTVLTVVAASVLWTMGFAHFDTLSFAIGVVAGTGGFAARHLTT
jgi:hypothetical protein